MCQRGVLSKLRSGERGSAPVETTFAIVILLLLVLGTIEVALALYARNVLIASAHEGARAAVEIGRGSSDASAIVEATVRRGAGGLVDDLDVAASITQVGDRSLVNVTVRGVIDAYGPVPLPIPITARASATKEQLPR